MPAELTEPLLATLRNERRRRGWSQEVLGHQLGRASCNTLYQWESGKNDLRLSNFVAWAKALGYRVTLTPVEENVGAQDDAA